MKNSNEMVNSLLERRDQYAAEQKRKRKIITHTVTSMCCVCLVALLGFGIWKGGMFYSTPPEQTAEDALYPGIKDSIDESEGESRPNPVAYHKIIIHSIDGISAKTMNIALMRHDFVEMTREEMINYYGIDYIPDLPSDINVLKEKPIGIFRRNGGTGEVYWDADVLDYANEDYTKTVHLNVQKGRNVFVDCYCFEGTEDKSLINNVEVLIGLSENGYYYAEFMYKGVGFLLSAEGITEDEFIEIVASIFK